MTAETILYVATAILISLFLAIFHYKTKGKGFFKKYLLFIVLRTITIATILLLIFNPKLRKKSFFIEKPTLVVAIDNSSSISFLDQTENANTFIEKLNESSQLKDRFDIEFTTFGNDLGLLDTPDFSEGQTKISDALLSFKEAYRNKKAPVLVITDGNQTYGDNYAFTTINFPQAIYPVALGDTVKYIDLSISKLNVNKYAYFKNEFPVEVILNYNGENDLTTTFQITKGATKVYSKELKFSKDNSSEVISTTLPANTIGIQIYKAELLSKNEERNTANNTKDFAIEVIDQKTNILLVSDIVHPDLGAFKKSIESNELRSVDLRKPTIDISELDDYQMVILYQPNRRFKKLFEAIDTKNLNSFIITGTKTDWNFLNRIQNHFSKVNTRQSEDVQATLNLGYNNFAVEDIDFYEYPPLEDFLGDITVSNASSVVLEQRIRDIITGNPLLLTIENDKKRQAVLFGENIWKWRAQNYLNDKSFENFDTFLGKIIFYLATTKQKSRLNVNYESFYNGSSEIKISAEYFNKNYEFDSNASISIDLKNKTTNTSRSIPLLLKNNYYEANLSGIPTGEYDFVIIVANEPITRSGSFKILDFNIEKQFLNANINDLKIAAQNTGGKLFFPNEFNGLEETLLENELYKPVQKSKENIVPLIDWKFLLAIIIISLTAEWFLRKYNGLI